ncbi:DUF3560 domain-containing protein [Pendulispora brunnea]|uniref:DUF3560 domain-containing protein n=1 Tax=Pendulispora brunnea TaxID=2905690 RepID=A0ABZ2KKI4_9BACT
MSNNELPQETQSPVATSPHDDRVSAEETSPAVGVDVPAESTVAECVSRETSGAAILNAYERKRAVRIERLRQRADRREAEAQVAHARAHTILDGIPAGQPILVGHHSEKRHRRDLARADNGLRKAYELDKQAKHLRRRADSAEDNRAIFSDDPDALPKLRERVLELERAHALMVKGNRIIRCSTSPVADLRALGFSVHEIARAIAPDPMGNKGFSLSHSSANIRRLRKRIAELEAQAERGPRPPVRGDGAQVEEDDNRVRIYFDAKPDEAMRKRLRREGFIYSPTVGAWQRHASALAWDKALRLVGLDPYSIACQRVDGASAGPSTDASNPNVDAGAASDSADDRGTSE